MKFIINNTNWEIIELDNVTFHETRVKKFKEQREKVKETEFILGFCDFSQHQIYLNKYLCKEEKRRTLIHELVHCFLWVNGASYTSYVEDAVCDTVAAIFDFVDCILKAYFK